MSTSQAKASAQAVTRNEKSADARTLRLAAAFVLAAAGLSFGAWQIYGFMQPREIRSASDTARMVAGGPAADKGGMPASDRGVAGNEDVDDGIVREFLESTSPEAAAAVETLTRALPAKLTELGDVAMTQGSVQGFVGLAMNKLAALMKDGLVGVLDRPAGADAAGPDQQESIRTQVRAQMGGMGTLLEGAKYDISRARVVSLAEGVGAGMKKARGGGERFASVMRFATGQGTEKDPGGELRVPFLLKGSTNKRDDGEIGIVLRRIEDGETWAGGGVNLYLKDPSVIAKLMKDRPPPGRIAAPAPEKKADGGVK